VPLRVDVATRPALVHCSSVNVSVRGMGLVAVADGRGPPPRRGGQLELAFRLPDGAGVRTHATIMWTCGYMGLGQPGWALGVRFDGLSRAAEAAIGAYVESNRTRVAVALPSEAESALARQTLAGAYRLLVARSREAALSLAARGDVAALVVFGQEAEAAAFLEACGRAAAGGGAPAPVRPIQPRVVCCAPLGATRLLELFNAGTVFRWLPVPPRPEDLARAVSLACADYRAAADRDHVALALARERRAAWKRHVRVASAALERRLLPAEVVSRTLVELLTGPEASVDELWRGAGRLAPEDLEEILGAPGRGGPASAGRDGPGGAGGSPAPAEARGTLPLAAATFVLDAALVESEAAREGLGHADTRVPLEAPGGPPGARPAREPRPSPAAAPHTGDLERYQNATPVGEGGMGIVVAADDTRLGRRVALKMLQERLLDRPDLVRMIEREARVVGSLEHPNIVPVYDAGRTPRGTPFYAMRLIQEPSLAALLGRLQGDPALESSELGLPRLLRLFTQVCRTVDYAHSRGVIHCDLKPDNILVGSFGEVLVVDWGLAFVRDEGTVFRGGSFGYVAPEQMAAGVLDARTDVYALGSILYELLCLQPPFPQDADYFAAGRECVSHPGRLPPRPRQVAPHRNVSEELEDIALTALAVEPGGRFASAGALAAAVDEFLEGTKERERRGRRADELVAHAGTLADNYFELLASRPDRVVALSALRAGIAPWDPPDRKRALWDEEEGLAVTDSLTVRTMQAAVAAYEQALDEVRDHAGARAGLARLYASELRRAEERRDEHDRVYFQELVNQYDDGRITESARGGGTLSVESTGGDVVVALARLEERDRRLVALARTVLGPAPLAEVPLAQGSYVVTLSASGGRTLRFPVLVKARAPIRITTDLAALDPDVPGELLIPGGPTLLGGAEGGGELRTVGVASFYIQERPVIFREYLEFLTDVYRQLGSTALDLFPRHGQGAPFWTFDGRNWAPGEVKQWGDDPEDLLDLPVFGIDVRCAEAYARWKARQTGLGYRLPTEDEWEKAARGTDGRLYPWGNHFDASFCCMRASSPGAPRPRPPGAFEADVSPFGVRDLAGGVADWVTPSRRVGRDEQETVSRGGAWCDWRGDCLLTARRPYLAVERSARVGLRLVRPAPPSTAYFVDG
jgi:serine/threonine-protein kinase